MVTLVEEILLLMLDDEKGTFVSVPSFSMEYAISGSLLMDLALRDRIDCDLEELRVVDSTPTGEKLLDPVLEALHESEEQLSVTEWLNRLALDIRPFQEKALDRLVERGIVRREERKVLWIFGRRCYPMIDDREEKEVKLRLLEILFSDEIPDARDAVLISLADACALFDHILSRDQVRSARPRIDQIAKVDLIGQAMHQMILEMRKAVSSVPPQM